MTREEAIDVLSDFREFTLSILGKSIYADRCTALDMAIEALSQPIVAKHFDIQSGYIYCSPQIAENVEVVVRCKDCRWWNEDDFPRVFPEKKTSACVVPNIYGANFKRYTQEDEFCSRGERREP